MGCLEAAACGWRWGRQTEGEAAIDSAWDQHKAGIGTDDKTVCDAE